MNSHDKFCTGCKSAKSIALFSRNRAMKDGYANWCKSCLQGLQGRPAYAARRKEKRQRDPLAELVLMARHRAKKSGLAFDLVPQDLVMPEICPVLGIPIVCGGAKLTANSPTLDRINPALGYVQGNCIVISWRANKLKSDCDDPEIFDRIARYMRGAMILCWESNDSPHGVHAQAIAIRNPQEHEAVERTGVPSPVR
jgi:hypothetical protein